MKVKTIELSNVNELVRKGDVTIANSIFDCSSNKAKARVDSMRLYNSANKLKNTVNEKSSWFIARPNTPYGNISEVICNLDI